MAHDPTPRFWQRELPSPTPHQSIDRDEDTFVDPDDDEDCRAGLMDFDRFDDDD
ncbi:hypothetical protein [Reyranella sp. CPCC 100927]|uniref:hypothetical protein n=1 Tax=Reyranella sp. CPCC 100927 TaxID=2599616 RepID=UPI0015B4F6FE|nr:hypothetical protein [Reyranella sp. CPCC 100927]